MFIVGFATAVEIAHLEDQGFEVEDANLYNLVGPSAESRNEDGFLMARPVPNADGTKAIVISIGLALYDGAQRLITPTPLADNSLDVETFQIRRRKLWIEAAALRADAEAFKYCSHKNPDGSDARYAIGNGETACVCGNKWD